LFVTEVTEQLQVVSTVVFRPLRPMDMDLSWVFFVNLSTLRVSCLTDIDEMVALCDNELSDFLYHFLLERQ
jgi:hypothetical protein